MNLSRLCPDGILFDLDGTLWDATAATEEAWREVLRRHPDVAPAVPLTRDGVCRYMGLTNEELGAIFFPDRPDGERMRLMRESCDLENRILAKRGGALFPDVLKTLSALAGRFPLFIVSNCQCGYIENFLTANGGAPYIRDYECSDRTKMEKADNIRLIMERNGLRAPIYVGDTTSDSAAAEKVGTPFVYARYGFGERYGRGKVENFVYFIDAVNELAVLLSADRPISGACGFGESL